MNAYFLQELAKAIDLYSLQIPSDASLNIINILIKEKNKLIESYSSDKVKILNEDELIKLFKSIKNDLKTI